MTTPFTIYASIVLATFTRNAFLDISPQQLLRSAIEKSEPKMWYSLTDFSVLGIVTESLSLLSTCWCLGRSKGGNEASIDNASFVTLLSWFFRFSAGVEKGSVACRDGGNDVPSSTSLMDVSRNACLEGKLFCREGRTRPKGTTSSHAGDKKTCTRQEFFPIH